jgi:hypothetical protein
MKEIFAYLDVVVQNNTIHVYAFVLIILHVIYALVFFKIIDFDQTIINYTNIAIQTFICVCLFIRFNTWRKLEITENDRKIILSTAAFLFSNLAITQYFLHSFTKNYMKV